MVSPLLAFSQKSPIVAEVSWVKERMSDPRMVLLQVSSLKYDFDREHIPGAQFLWPEALAPNSPEGNFNVPKIEDATKLLQALGINNNSYIVVYHIRNEVSLTARMFLTLEHLGFKGRVSFLNGGLEAWKAAGELTTAEAQTPKRGNVKLTLTDLIVNKDYVLKTLSSSNGVVVDARMKRYYDGEPTGYPRDGHIKGAVNVAYTDLINKENKIKPADSLQSYFPGVIDASKEVVTYCFIGQTASVVYLAGRVLGYNMRLYDGSMQEWSRIESLPMEKTPATTKEN